MESELWAVGLRNDEMGGDLVWEPSGEKVGRGAGWRDGGLPLC